MHIWTSWGVLGCPRMSWGIKTDRLKRRDSRLKILINEWSEIFNSKLGFKSSKETGIEICKTNLIRNIQTEVKQ